MKRIIQLVLVCAATACGSDGGLTLDRGVGDNDQRFARLRASLAIEINAGPSGHQGDAACSAASDEANPCCNTEYCSARGLAALLESGCAKDISSERSTLGCGSTISFAETQICVAERLLLIIDSPGDQVYSTGVYEDITVGRQDAESNTALATEALQWTSRPLIDLGNALADTGCRPFFAAAAGTGPFAETDGDEIDEDGNPLLLHTIGGELVHFYRDALRLAEDAADHVARAGAAVSDAQLSRATDPATAASLRNAPFASRTAAAHVLVGGAHGLPAITTDPAAGLFTRPALSRSGMQALDILRWVAIDPVLLAKAISIDDLIAGTAGVGEQNSIRYRLSRFLANESLRTADPSAVASRIGVTTRDFQEAREWIVEQNTAFDRTPDPLAVDNDYRVKMTLEPELLADGTVSDFPLYAATRLPPTESLDAVWSAIARFDPSPALAATTMWIPNHSNAPHWEFRDPSDETLPPGATWGNEQHSGDAWVFSQNPGERNFGRTFASLREEAVLHARSLMAILSPEGPMDPLRSELLKMREVLAGILPRGLGGDGDRLGDGTAQLAGRARICGFNFSTTGYWLELDLGSSGITNPEGIEIVLGQDGLNCAVRGAIDGVACSAAQLTSLLANASTPVQPLTGAAPGHFFAIVDPAPGSGPRPNLSSFFLVRRRAPHDGAITPGAYDPITGFVVNAADPDTAYCIGTPIMQDLDADVAGLIAPLVSDPSRSAMNCSGLPENMRLPLENELTRDMYEEESSWRHYMNLARAASAESDRLLDELVNTRLQMDLRTEAQMDELERVCGVRLNFTSFARSLPDRVTPPPCAEGIYSAVTDSTGAAQHCVLDPIKWATEIGALQDADVERLEKCIGDSASIPWAIIGDQPVCIWYSDPAEPSTLCADASSSKPCPVVAWGKEPREDAEAHEKHGVCAGYLPADEGYTPQLISRGTSPTDPFLGLFAIPEPPPNGPGGGGGGSTSEDLPCEALAALRRGIAGDDALSKVLESSLLDQRSMAAYTAPLGWMPSAGDFSRVTYGGTSIASTGAPTLTGATALWPQGTMIGGMDVLEQFCPSETSDPAVAIPDPLDNDGSVFCLGDVPVDNTVSSRRMRARANDMLGRAVLAARLIGGHDFDTVYVPYAPRIHGWDDTENTGFHRPTVSMNDVGITSAYFEARDGTLHLDQPGDTGGSEPIGFDELGMWAEVLTDRPEWTQCPYDAESADDCSVMIDYGAAQTDKLPYPGLPLLIRALDGGYGVTSDLRVSGLFPDDLNANIPRAVEPGTVLLPPALQRAARFFDASAHYNVGHDWGHGCSDAAGCPCHHRPLACVRAYSKVPSTRVGNLLHLSRGPNSGGMPQFTWDDVLNGMELACAGARIRSDHPELGCDEPPDVQTLGDMLQAESFLRCQADGLAAAAGGSVLADLPAGVAVALRQTGSRTAGTESGEVAAKVSELHGALEAFAATKHDISQHIRMIAGRIREARERVAQSELAHRIEDLSLQSQIFNQVTSCVVAVATIASQDAAASVGRGFAAAATCINSGFQIGFATAISSLEHEEERSRLAEYFARVDSDIAGMLGEIGRSAQSVKTHMATIDAALTRIKSLQQGARNALSRALYLETDGAAAHNAVSAQYRSRYNTVLTRYRRAHERSVRTAYIARRAVEQRLAMPLESITEELATVEPPASWVDELCTGPVDPDVVSGIASFADGGVDEGGASQMFGEEGYAASYIGDYVDRLEQVVESYSFAFPFREGTDTTVVSLRDDVFATSAPCEVESPNLLLQSTALDVLATDSRPGWYRRACDPGAAPNGHCVSARQLPVTEDTIAPPITGSGLDFGEPTRFVVSFGGSTAATQDTALAQDLYLTEGRYRLSWYALVADGSGRTAVRVLDENAETLDDATVEHRPGQTDGMWTRYHTFVDVPSNQTVTVALVPSWTAPDQTTIVERVLAGVMLEDVSRTVVGDPWRAVPSGSTTVPFGELAAPGPFYATGATRTRVLHACVDTTGATFRRQAWTYGCVSVCPDGYEGSCPPEFARKRCYHQTNVPVGSYFMDGRFTGTPTGFAGGNFNYRIENVAINVVGTGIRVCDDAPGCFASGNISFSMLHGGPYLVTNARGEFYSAPLFRGRLESARALTAERYITNPISSADESLLQAYRRHEFIGRPMGGTLTLRLWDEPGLDFDRVEDVQLVMTYRYWQRQR